MNCTAAGIILSIYFSLLYSENNLLITVPLGTFYNESGLQNETGCLPCLAGYYCDGTGNVIPSKKCREGFWCRGGSPEEMPIDQPYGTDCPNGSYCPTGTPSPMQCPKGTYQPYRRKIQVEDCVACDAGKFCDNTGLSAVSGNCQRGFFCNNSAIQKNPQDGVTGNICPVGSFCVEGSSKPQACQEGTYMNHTGLSGLFYTVYLVLRNLNRWWVQFSLFATFVIRTIYILNYKRY